MPIREEILAYQPRNEQEAQDKALMLDYLDNNDDAFCAVTRSGILRHLRG